MPKIVIYGAGDFGVEAHRYYSRTNDIVAFVDSDPRKTGKRVCGVAVHSPKDLASITWDRIFVASGHANEIIDILACEHGITGESIFKVPNSVLHDEKAYGTDDLVALIKRLEEASVAYWLDHSSLLGLIRDQAPASKDVDLAVSLDDFPKFINVVYGYVDAEQIRVYRYGFNSERWDRDDVRQVKLFGYLDIHFKIRHQDSCFWLVGPMLLKVDSRFYEGYDTRAWRDIDFRVPCQPENYLRILYGDWELPAESWSYSDYRNIERVFRLEEMQGGMA